MKCTQKLVAFLLLCAGLGAAATSQAALVSRLSGQAIYDTDRNITWLENANTNALMDWASANAWAGGLNIGGYTGWRLPTGLNADSSGPCAGYGCTGSELGHLYYTVGGLSSGEITDSALLSSYFSNLQNGTYWSGTEDASDPTVLAWVFQTDSGFQSATLKEYSGYAWAVRDGDVGGGSVPEPTTFALFGIGAFAWAGVQKKRRGSATS